MHLKKSLYLIVALSISSAVTAQQTETGTNDTIANNKEKTKDTIIWIFNVKEGSFERGNAPKDRLKEGTFIGIKYTHVNPFIVTTNSSFTRANEDISSATTTLRQLINTIVTSPQPDISKSGSNGDVGQNTNNPSAKDILTKWMNIERHIDSNVQAIVGYQKSINSILAQKKIVIAAKNDSSITDSNAFKNRIAKVNGFISNVDYNKLSSLFNEHFDSIETSLFRLRGYLVNLKALEIDMRDVGVATQPLTVEIDSIGNRLLDLGKIYDAANRLQLQDQISSILDDYVMGITSDYTIPPRRILQFKDDQITFTDTLRTKSGSILTIIEPIQIYSYGGRRINVSLGLAATFGNLNATSYNLIKDSAGNVTSIHSSRANSIGNFSPILAISLIFPTNIFVSPGITVGLNPDFSDIGSSRLLFGGTFKFSESNSLLNRFFLSAGVAMGMTKCLLTKYENITDYSQLRTLSESQLTENAFRWGGFLSVTFNISKK